MVIKIYVSGISGNKEVSKITFLVMVFFKIMILFEKFNVLQNKLNTKKMDNLTFLYNV